jgi:hypothetical protein
MMQFVHRLQASLASRAPLAWLKMSQKTYGQLKAEGQVETLLRKPARDEESRLMSAIEKERSTQLELKKSRVPTLKSPASFVAGQRNKDKSWRSHLTRMRRTRPEIPTDGRPLQFGFRSQ